MAFLQNAVEAIQGSYFIGQRSPTPLTRAQFDITDEVTELLGSSLFGLEVVSWTHHLSQPLRVLQERQ